MRILIPTLTYGRPQVFKVFAQGIRDLQKAFPKIDIECLAVGSGDKEMVEAEGIEYFNFKNDPLADKAEYRLSICRNKADYYLFLGSDDIITVEVFQYYLDRIADGHDWIAPYDLYLYHEGCMYHSKGYEVGHMRHGESLAVGRCLSNEILNSCGWSLWRSGRTRNIDKEAYDTLRRHTQNKHFFKLKGVGVLFDIKTKDNLSNFTPSTKEFMGKAEQFLPNTILKPLRPLRKSVDKTAVVNPNVELGKNVTIQAGAVIGCEGAIRGKEHFNGTVRIGDNVFIGSNVVIAVGTSGITEIGDYTIVMNQALIGHNVKIGRDCEIGAGVNVCGYAKIGNNTVIKTGCNIRNRVKIGKNVTVGIGSNVLNDLTAPGLYYGNPATPPDGWTKHKIDV